MLEYNGTIAKSKWYAVDTSKSETIARGNNEIEVKARAWDYCVKFVKHPKDIMIINGVEK